MAPDSQTAADGPALSVVLVDGETSRKLNRQYLGHDWATDVLAFDLRDAEAADTDSEVVAEIYVCLEVAIEATTRYATTLDAEVMLYIVHGMLHLAGENDHTAAEKRRMRAAERRVMRELSLRLPLSGMFAARRCAK